MEAAINKDEAEEISRIASLKSYEGGLKIFLIWMARRYIYHVLNLVGGIYDTPHNENQKGVVRYVNVDINKQMEALKFMEKNLWNTQNWLNCSVG